jgi:oxygen-independent coproporphyrinogen-3 oxidase
MVNMVRADDRKQNLSLYLAIPFCQVRCAYCDFNTYAGLDDLMTPYARALAQEIRMVGDASQKLSGQGRTRAVHTIFFGGGTPSLVPLGLYADIFSALRESFELTSDCEMTLEANPGTVNRPYLEGLRELGVNRLSFGAQSSHPHELRLLDRLHLFGDVVQAVSWARAAGFDNLNLDLIFAIPQQTMAMWQATLNRVLALGPDHISCYALSLEHGTPMRAWVYRGLLPMPDPDLAAEMYEWASATLEANGYVQYEISNWAKNVVNSEQRAVISELPTAHCSRPVYACRHNVQYWRNEPYLGFGAGAHGFIPASLLGGDCGYRYSAVLAPAAYIERLNRVEIWPFPFSPAVAQSTPVTTEDEMGEMMMMGLRLVREGVSDDDFRARFGVGLEERYPKELRRLRDLRLIEWDGIRARLTPNGRLLGNRVFREFV